LALAHTLLSDSRWHGADLGTLVTEEFAPYRTGNKVEVKGPNVSLSPATAQGIALALHELATNAAKHGALSSLKGKVCLTWTLKSDILTLHWEENGGPPIKAPSARSFGLKVIKASIEQQLGGQAAFDWNPKGLRCELTIALREAGGSRQPEAAHQANGGNGAAIPLQKVGKPRVLVVEDEALVGIMIQECLSEFGFQIMGPIGTASEALAAAKDGDFDAAILDINLGDDMVYKVAEILSRRHVPFAFVTGYDADSVDSRFRDVPVLQKPVEREMLQKLFAQSGGRTAAALAGTNGRARVSM
jgi:CheY-like chemotaxis protein